jgi:hypothetical protein
MAGASTGHQTPNDYNPVKPVGQAVAIPSETRVLQQLLGPELSIAQAPGMPETERFAPAVAENWVRRGYLVVWHNRWPGLYHAVLLTAPASSEHQSTPTAGGGSQVSSRTPVWKSAGTPMPGSSPSRLPVLFSE